MKTHHHRTAAIVWSRHLPGILAQSFSAPQAQVLAAALHPLGLHVIVFRQDEMPTLHNAQEVHHARCEENGLLILDLHGEAEKIIPWPAVQMICVGEAPIETAHHYPAGTWAGVSAGRHYQRPDLEVALTPRLEVWIACASPFPALRIADKKMNYEYLGPRRQDSSSAALKSLQALTGLPSGNGTSAVSFKHVVRFGTPTHEVIALAKETSAGTIIMGTRGRSRLAHMVLGGVAEAVLRDAPCPVLIVPETCGSSRNAHCKCLLELDCNSTAPDLLGRPEALPKACEFAFG